MGKADTIAVLSATGGTTLTAAGLMVGGQASAVALPVAVSQLLALAGVSASIPVVGWVIAGLAGAAAGSIAIVRAVRTAKIKKAALEAEARGLKLENVDSIGPYIVKAFKKGKQWRADEAERLISKIQKNPDRNGKTRKKDVEKLRFLILADLDERAATRGNAPQSASMADIEKNIPAESDGMSTTSKILGFGLVLGLARIFIVGF